MQMRLIDDKIVYALNNSLPTESIRKRTEVDPSNQCKLLMHQIEQTYDLRETALKACILQTQDKASKAIEAHDKAAQRQAQMHLRLYRNEVSVEEVIRQRTQKIFHEKCRDFLTS